MRLDAIDRRLGVPQSEDKEMKIQIRRSIQHVSIVIAILIALPIVKDGKTEFIQKAHAVVADGASRQLNQTAKVAVRSLWAERAWGYCSRFVRQVHEKALPSMVNYMRTNLFGGSAMETARMWRRMGRTRSLAQVQALGGIKGGDVLFQEYGSGGYGHVGMAVEVNGEIMVAENTTRNGNRWDNRTITPLNRFGRITAVGRFNGFNR